jgi:hypothetical protein
MTKILRLNAGGTPTAWITREDAALLYTKDLVLWDIGKSKQRLMGGTNRQGIRSFIEINPVIAIRGNVYGIRENRKSFNNHMLFKRDHHVCMYCGQKHAYSELTRDHVTPRAHGGEDIWENVVAACKRCNHFKADRTPEQAGLELLAVPFAPNIFEWMYLAQHNVLADQMDYLEKQFSGKRCWEGESA